MTPHFQLQATAFLFSVAWISQKFCYTFFYSRNRNVRRCLEVNGFNGKRNKTCERKSRSSVGSASGAHRHKYDYTHAGSILIKSSPAE